MRVAARFQLGAIILPTTLSTSQPTDLPLPGATDGSSQFDRMEIQVKTLHQQALATQSNLQKLKARDSQSPSLSAVTELQGLASAPFGSATGEMAIASALLLLTAAAAAMWWFFRHRPLAKATVLRNVGIAPAPAPAPAPYSLRTVHPESTKPVKTKTPTPTPSPKPSPTQPSEPVHIEPPLHIDLLLEPAPRLTPPAPSVAVPDVRVLSDTPVAVPPPEVTAPPPKVSIAVGIQTTALPVQVPVQVQVQVPVQTNHLRPDGGFRFNSAAAATEVQRVRKSLAEKREARSLLLEYEEEVSVRPEPLSAMPEQRKPSPSQEWDIELEPSQDPDSPHLSLAKQPVHVAADLTESPLPTEIVATKPKEDLTASDEPPTLAQTLTAEPVDLPEIEPLALQPEGTITLALAQESFALGLLVEARELAHEVLEYGNHELIDQAQALLKEIAACEAAKLEATSPEDPI